MEMKAKYNFKKVFFSFLSILGTFSFVVQICAKRQKKNFPTIQLGTQNYITKVEKLNFLFTFWLITFLGKPFCTFFNGPELRVPK
jgi:hypothetical protein